MDIVIKDLDEDDEKAKIHVDKLLSVAMNTQHYFDVRSLVDRETTDENGFIDIEKLLDKAEEVSPYRKANLVYEVRQMIKKLDVPLDKNMTDEKQKLYDNITKTFTHKDGRTYNILSLNGNDYLLQNQKTGDYIIACGLDRISGEWEHGIYYGNTPDQLAFASLEFNKRGEVNPDFGEKVFEILGYEEIFNGLMSLEFDQWKKLDCKSKESIYQEFFSDDNMMLIDQDLFNKVESSISKELLEKEFDEVRRLTNVFGHLEDEEIEF